MYLSPEVKSFEVKTEGVICISFTGERSNGTYGEPHDPWAI